MTAQHEAGSALQQQLHVLLSPMPHLGVLEQWLPCGRAMSNFKASRAQRMTQHTATHVPHRLHAPQPCWLCAPALISPCKRVLINCKQLHVPQHYLLTVQTAPRFCREAHPHTREPPSGWPIPKALHYINPPTPLVTRGRAGRTGQLPGSFIAAAAATCRSLHPDWEFRPWGEAEGRKLIEERYPWALSTFDTYPYPSQRSFALRLFVLHAFGGGAFGDECGRGGACVGEGAWAGGFRGGG